MGANVVQWNETLIGGSARGLLAGAFSSSVLNLVSQERESADPAITSNNAVGFRVAMLVPVPEPSSIVLAVLAVMTLGSAGFLRRRRAA
jgi:hypothetical protein